jgi:hypothetical protein
MILEWALINIIVPIALPMLGLWLVSWTMPLTSSLREKTKPLVTVRDGQLGWLAVAWAAAAISDALSYMERTDHPLPSLGTLLMIEFFIVLGGMFVAAGGAVTALNGRRNKHRYLIGSAAVTVMSASAWGFVHTAIR